MVDLSDIELQVQLDNQSQVEQNENPVELGKDLNKECSSDELENLTSQEYHDLELTKLRSKSLGML